jgi:hypothetical protein
MDVEPSNAEAAHQTWIPPGGLWSLWAKSVLFAQMGKFMELPPLPTVEAPWAAALGKAVVILDVPGQQAVLLGLALAQHGYRPVPAFNGCHGPHAVIPQYPIQQALCLGARRLSELSLPPDAPPVFLLDEDRMLLPGHLQPGSFNNRWRVYGEDFPSARFLLDHGLDRVALVQRSAHPPQEDLHPVLRTWQEGGLALFSLSLLEATTLQPLHVERPRWYRSGKVWSQVLSSVGLKQGPRAGWGYTVPSPPSTHG